MHIKTKFENFLNEGIFPSLKRKTPLEKIENLFIKLNKHFEDLALEAGGEDNLSRGVSLGYDNFGDFVETSYKILEKIKNFLQKQTLDNENFVKIVRFLDDLKDKTDKVNYVRGVSSISVQEFKWVKRNLDYLLQLLKQK